MDRTLIRHLAEENVSRLALYPRVAWATVRRRRGLAERVVRFGEHPEQYLLFFEPPEGLPRRHTSLYFLHGGGWRSGSPVVYTFVGRAMAARGFVTAVGGYRLAPAAHFPAQLDDAVSGFLAARCAGADLQASTAPAGGGNEQPCSGRGPVVARRWVVGGFSAGGHLAALLALHAAAHREPTPSTEPLPTGHTAPPLVRAGSRRLAPGDVAGLLSINSPFDLSVYGRPWPGSMLWDLLGPECDPRVASPIEFVRGDEELPCLVIQGSRDPHVPPASAARFARALNNGRNPGPARLLRAEWMHHADSARLFTDSLPETERIVSWLDGRGGRENSNA